MITKEKEKGKERKRKRVSTIELMRACTSDELESMHPNIDCHKCGKRQWLRESVPLTWICRCCGNLIYIELGAPVQQIDIVRKAERLHAEAQ